MHSLPGLAVSEYDGPQKPVYAGLIPFRDRCVPGAYEYHNSNMEKSPNADKSYVVLPVGVTAPLSSVPDHPFQRMLLEFKAGQRVRCIGGVCVVDPPRALPTGSEGSVVNENENNDDAISRPVAAVAAAAPIGVRSPALSVSNKINAAAHGDDFDVPMATIAAGRKRPADESPSDGIAAATAAAAAFAAPPSIRARGSRRHVDDNGDSYSMGPPLARAWQPPPAIGPSGMATLSAGIAAEAAKVSGVGDGFATSEGGLAIDTPADTDRSKRPPKVTASLRGDAAMEDVRADDELDQMEGVPSGTGTEEEQGLTCHAGDRRRKARLASGIGALDSLFAAAANSSSQEHQPIQWNIDSSEQQSGDGGGDEHWGSPTAMYYGDYRFKSFE